mmetsp:Transcript_4560/g.11572  ORF Transcript_4560/g.11572 Transcript_4560/m.11572 type:complete len:1435 (-) Transcript_4560:181-4485(-)
MEKKDTPAKTAATKATSLSDSSTVSDNGSSIPKRDDGGNPRIRRRPGGGGGQMTTAATTTTTPVTSQNSDAHLSLPSLSSVQQHQQSQPRNVAAMVPSEARREASSNTKRIKESNLRVVRTKVQQAPPPRRPPPPPTLSSLSSNDHDVSSKNSNDISSDNDSLKQNKNGHFVFQSPPPPPPQTPTSPQEQHPQGQQEQMMQNEISPLSPTSLSKHVRENVASYISSSQQQQQQSLDSRRRSSAVSERILVKNRRRGVVGGGGSGSNDSDEKKWDGNSDVSSKSGGSVLSDQKRKGILQNALDRASGDGLAAAARAVSDGQAIVSQDVDRKKSTDSNASKPTASSLPRQGDSNDPSIHPRMSFVQLKSENRSNSDDSDMDDFGSALHRTRSAEEVLQLAKSHINEAQAQINSRPNIPVRTPHHSPHPKFPSIEASASSKNHHPEILTPPIRDFIEQQRDNDKATIGTPSTVTTPFPDKITDTQEFFNRIASPSASEIALYDDLEAAVKLLPGSLRRSYINESGQPVPNENILRTLNGIYPSPAVSRNPSMKSNQSDLSHVEDKLTNNNVDDDDDTNNDLDATSVISGRSALSKGTMKMQRKAPKKPVVIKSMEVAQQPQKADAMKVIYDFITGNIRNTKNDDHGDDNNGEMDDHDNGDEEQINYLLSGLTRPMHHEAPGDETSTVIPGSSLHKNLHSFAKVVEDATLARTADPRMPEWVENKFMVRQDLPKNGTYQLGESKTIIVHEILRGHWTWCTAWSPCGSRLALATDNHHLSVVDATSSCVWRIRHDRKALGPQKNGTTHSIRSIAWGDNFIAIGGTGNAVSILAPTEPYPILHTITPTGFVGSLDWLPHTNKLLVGSRLGKAVLFEIWAKDEQDKSNPAQFSGSQVVREIQSTVIHMVDRGKAWVNSVKFSPDGKCFAVGDSFGILGIYSLTKSEEEWTTGNSDAGETITNLANFKLEDAILAIEWAADGEFLYAGGEDFAITIISTRYWEPVHRIARERWIEFISSSHGATHVAVGGIASEVSLLDVGNGWDNVINISLKGLVPLHANWHPKDQYLVLTGQNNSVLAIETTNARHVLGHFLRSFHAIISIAFSPDGRMVAIGNEMGVISIFRLSDTTFVSDYEMVVDCNGSLSIEWSKNGAYAVITATDKVVVVARAEMLPGPSPPKTSGFFVAHVIGDLGEVYDVTIDPTSRFVAASGNTTKILDATTGFKNVLEIENGGMTLANSWSLDGKWFAAAGKNHSLVIYDTSHINLAKWESVFTVKMANHGLSLAWAPSCINGLQYLAYGGEDKRVNILEIRTKQRTWENVLSVPRDGHVNDIDWNADGLVAAAIGNGTVSILDLSYLQNGHPVNEMDYSWQRQALTCFTEIRRNRGKHAFQQVAWVPSAASNARGSNVGGKDSLLAIGGTDGEVEIVDLTARKNCRGFRR